MEEQFVTYELALKLKELGFNEKCFDGYLDGELYVYGNAKKDSKAELTPTPLWQQAFSWIMTDEMDDRYLVELDRGGWGLYDREEEKYLCDTAEKTLKKLIRLRK